MTKASCLQWESYHDNELDEGQREQFENHLQQCVACQTRLEQIAQIESDLLAILYLRDELLGPEPEPTANLILDDVGSSARSLRDKLPIGQSNSEFHDLGQRRSIATRLPKRFGVALAIVASLTIIVIGLGWHFSKPGPTHVHMKQFPEVVDPRERESHIHRVETEAASPIEVLYHFDRPTIANRSVSTPRFTYIEVYPQVERIDRAAEVPDTSENDPSTF